MPMLTASEFSLIFMIIIWRCSVSGVLFLLWHFAIICSTVWYLDNSLVNLFLVLYCLGHELSLNRDLVDFSFSCCHYFLLDKKQKNVLLIFTKIFTSTTKASNHVCSRLAEKNWQMSTLWSIHYCTLSSWQNRSLMQNVNSIALPPH